MRLTAHTLIVTGAAGGIGRAICARLAAEGAGVALLDLADTVHDAARELAAACPEAAGRLLALQADVGDAAAVQAAVAAVQQRLGPVSGLVNNAGLTATVAPITRMSDAQWQQELAVNLTGPFNLIRTLLPGMVERGFGRIVNISSVAARGGLWRQAAYSATKSGLLGLTRNVVLEYAEAGITCNAILPGLIETPAVRRLPTEISDFALSLTPARRLGQPEEIAALVAFLCTEEAGYLNGAEIDIDGGGRLCPMVLGSVREVQARRTWRQADAQATAAARAPAAPPAG